MKLHDSDDSPVAAKLQRFQALDVHYYYFPMGIKFPKCIFSPSWFMMVMGPGWHVSNFPTTVHTINIWASRLLVTDWTNRFLSCRLCSSLYKPACTGTDWLEPVLYVIQIVICKIHASTCKNLHKSWRHFLRCGKYIADAKTTGGCIFRCQLVELIYSYVPVKGFWVWMVVFL